MTQFQSETKTIHEDAEKIYAMLSDLNNIEKVKDQIPQDKIKDLQFDTDSFKVSVAPIGQIGLRIIEREPGKTIKFQSENAPVESFLWIQLKQVAEKETKIRITVKAEINVFLKGMLSKPIQQGIDKFADMLAQIQY